MFADTVAEICRGKETSGCGCRVSKGRCHEAAEALHRGLDILALAGGDAALGTYVRLWSLPALGYVDQHRGHVDEAERLYAAPHPQVLQERQPTVT